MIDFAMDLIERLRPRLRHGKRRESLRVREFPISAQEIPWYPRVPKLTPEELELLNRLRSELSHELGEFVENGDVLLFALGELQQKFKNCERDQVLRRLSSFLRNTRPKN